MPNYILTPIGTSILSNGLGVKINDGRKKINEFANYSGDEKDVDFINFKSELENNLEEFKEELLEKDDKELKKLSAELHALIIFYENNKESISQDFHKLLITDTYLGKKSAELIETIMKNKEWGIIDKLSPNGLKTNNIQEFQVALSDIVKSLSSELEDYKKQNYEIIFNLTGGFKSINSFLQTMASLWADKSIYVFEKTEELLIIPRLPIKVDEEIFVENLDVVRKLDLGLKISSEEIQNLPKTLYYEIDGEYTLSSWGDIVWEKIKKELYKKHLLSPLTDKIKYSKDFEKDFEKLNDEEKRQLNEKIDSLILYALNPNNNPKSLNYHDLSGEITKKFTNEFYAFQGNDSRRVYCNEKDNKIILEKIGSHLK